MEWIDLFFRNAMKDITPSKIINRFSKTDISPQARIQVAKHDKNKLLRDIY